MDQTTLTPAIIHVLDYFLAETLRFGSRSPSEVSQLKSLGPAHEALLKAGVKGGDPRLGDLCGIHEKLRDKAGWDVFDPEFKWPEWNQALIDEGVRQIACLVNFDAETNKA